DPGSFAARLDRRALREDRIEVCRQQHGSGYDVAAPGRSQVAQHVAHLVDTRPLEAELVEPPSDVPRTVGFRPSRRRYRHQPDLLFHRLAIAAMDRRPRGAYPGVRNDGMQIHPIGTWRGSAAIMSRSRGSVNKMQPGPARAGRARVSDPTRAPESA